MSQQEDRMKFPSEKEGKSSRLGKEAKIGAGVILVLLVVFVGVVVMRFAGAATDNPPPSDRVADNSTQKKPGESKDDPLFKDFNAKPMKSHKPTVVSVKPAPANTPKGRDGGFDKWKLASNKPSPKTIENRYASPSSQPPAFPEPPAPKPAGSRYDTPTIERNRHDSSGFSLADSNASAMNPVPPHRERSRYADDSAALLPPAAPPPDVVASDVPSHRDRKSHLADNDRGYTPAAPVSRYGDDYRRDSLESRYDRTELRGRGASSYSLAPPPSPRRNDGKYEVQPGDSYWAISEKVYGVGSYFNALAEKNRGAGGDDQLQPGQFVQTPSVEELEKAYPELCPKASRRETARERATTVSTRSTYRSGKTYTVAEGDTLFAIARYELGKASRWVELYDLNRDVLGKDFNYLTPGMKLTLPGDEKSDDVLTRRPKSEFRR